MVYRGRQVLQLIKQKLTLVIPNFPQSFKLHCDASKVRIRVVLSQNFRPVAYYSEKLNGAKLQYRTYDMEFYAILQVLKH